MLLRERIILTILWKKSIALMSAGAATTLAFAPFFCWWIVFFTLPYLMVTLRRAVSEKYTRHAWYGWCFGFGYCVASTYWIANALLVDASTYAIFIPFATAGLSSVLALYFALMTAVMWRYRTLGIVPYTALFAVSWVGTELLRSFLFTGFPWNLLGYAWGAYDMTLQAASLGGVWWLSALSVVLASQPLWWFERQKKAVCVICVSACVLLGYGALRLHNNPTHYHAHVQLRLVQAAIPQALKWDQEHKIAAFRKHVELSRLPADVPPTHIIWPESAMTSPFGEGDDIAQLLQEIAPVGGALLTGVVRIDPHSTQAQPIIYNALQSINAKGEIEVIYDKRLLVPFGEYMPLRSLIPFKKLTAGTIDFRAGEKATALQATGAPALRSLICYESIFPQLSHGSYPAWIVNITNDAWFGDSTGPQQHFHMARMRAVEQGVPLVRNAGAGISAVVDSYGRILHVLPVGAVGVLDSGLPLPASSETLYSRFGIGILVVTLCLYIAMGFWSRLRKSFLHL
jgi:apolipoprotein N-acyltransferase